MVTRTLPLPLPASAPLWVLIACSPAVLGLAPAPSSSETTSPPMMAGELDEPAARDVDGTWNYASGGAGRQRIDKAIAEATADMDPIAREIAKKKLRKELAPVSRIDIDIRRKKVSLHLGSMRIDDAALGTWVPWTHEGTKYQVHFSLTDDGKLIQRVRSRKSEIRRRFSPRDDRLLVSFRLRDDRLPEDVSFWLAYK